MVITDQIKSKTALNEKGRGWDGPEPCLLRMSSQMVHMDGSWGVSAFPQRLCIKQLEAP